MKHGKKDPLNVVLCQDSTDVTSTARSIIAELRKQGHDISIDCVSNKRELLEHLETRKEKGRLPPAAVFMDVGGVGEYAALQVIKWCDNNHPGHPLPELNFLSLSIDMALDAASNLTASEERVQPSFIDENELYWLKDYIGNPSRSRKNDSPPASDTFRVFLNKRLGTTFPLDNDAGYYAEKIRAMGEVTNDRILQAWERRTIPAEKVIGRLRNYAVNLSTTLQRGFYGGDNEAHKLPQDAQFYSSTGFPVKGPAVFTLEDVDQFYKPILVMRSYDPAVVPLLAQGKLGGLVVTSPYMASHLKLLCEAHMISGLFGEIPQGKARLTSEFNEEARPNLPPFFCGKTAKIAKQKIEKGQEIVVGAGNGDAISLTPPNALQIPSSRMSNINRNPKLRQDIYNLSNLNGCFDSLFRELGMPVHRVKANINSSDSEMLDTVGNIGLVRTEQMVALDTAQVKELKKIILQNDAAAYDRLAYRLQAEYEPLIRRLYRSDKSVRIRLFDFVHHEVLNKQEQQQFLSLHKNLDIHGGEALKKWPRLYKEQLNAIFKTMTYVRGDYFGAANTPLDIMMPAVKTEQDVLAIKNMVQQEARKLGIKPEAYRFGVMIETLESCENISQIAKHCDFISFGTNDLTQQHFGLSRSDLKAHARFAKKNGYDPFKKLAPEIRGILQSVITKGRTVNPALKIDLCGAQAADVETATELFSIGVDDISVSPTIGNLHGLPTILNYKRYDTMKDALQAAARLANKPEKGPQP